MKVWVLAHIHVHRAQREKVAAALEVMVAASRAEPGCLRYDLLVDADDSCRYSLIECYADALALAEHRESPHYRHYREHTYGWLAEPTRVRVLNGINVLD